MMTWIPYTGYGTVEQREKPPRNESFTQRQYSGGKYQKKGRPQFMWDVYIPEFYSLVSHYTDTHIHVFPVVLSLSIDNKQKKMTFKVLFSNICSLVLVRSGRQPSRKVVTFVDRSRQKCCSSGESLGPAPTWSRTSPPWFLSSLEKTGGGNGLS